MRKALIVGIDYYNHLDNLSGCANDARSIMQMLEYHANANKEINFQAPRLMTGTDVGTPVKRAELRAAVRELFADKSEIALFYFAGHGHVDETGGFLCSSESRTGDDGLSLAEVMALAGRSEAENKVVILDSCHSGVAGGRSEAPAFAEIKEGMTILTATTAEQSASERFGSGMFTNLLVDALSGAAANLVGDITPGSVYAHIDQSLGSWAQRPVFKTNVKSFVSLRKVKPPILIEELRQLADHFPTADYRLPLDPSFEPERSEDERRNPTILPPDPANTAVFAVLQRYVKVNLVRPVGAEHMWHAAMQSRSCELTMLGRHYRHLVANRLI